MAEIHASARESHRVIAWIDYHPKAIVVLHAAMRRAKELGCDWCVACVETPLRFPVIEDEMAQHMLRLCTLAEQMGAEVLHVQADSREKGLRSLLEKEKDRIALFIVGSTDTGRAFGRFRLRRQIWEQAVRLAGQYTRVEIIPLSNLVINKMRWNWRRLRFPRPIRFVYALAAVGVAFLAARGLEAALPPALFRVNLQNVSLLFMIACAFVSGRYGLLPGFVAAVTGFMTYNYFYATPNNILHSASVTEIINMVIFLSAGVLIALFTSRARSYAENVERRERSTQALFTLYRIASTAFSRQQALVTLQRKLSDMLEADVAFFLPPALNPDGIEPAVPNDIKLDEADRRALNACWDEMKTTGLAAALHANAVWRFEPMIAPAGVIGVMAIRPKSNTPFDMWLGYMLNNIADQTAVLIEHIELERSMENNRLREEREKLRSMLLSSVSHDLKTPLAGIIGGLSVYRSVGSRLTEERRAELIDSAFEEAQRLDSFITNILDMTRLESGKIDFHYDWYDMNSIVLQATKRIQHRLKQRELVVHRCQSGVEAYTDAMMMGQVLQNLLDNACKYTPDGSRIEIFCNVDTDRGLLCRIHDSGPGIPEERLDRVFDKYERLQKTDSQIAGTGLGLAICKAVMEAQGGWITAANHPEGGAEFMLCLPKWRKTNTKSTTREEVA